MKVHLTLPDDEVTDEVLTYCGLPPERVTAATNAAELSNCSKCVDAWVRRCPGARSPTGA